MDHRLVIDSSGAWVRKIDQQKAEKPLPPENFGSLPVAVEHSFDFMTEQYEEPLTLLPE